MKLERMVEIETNDIHVGDRIRVGKYTATCTDTTSKAALFLLDQYITGHGYLREALQSEEVLNDFADIRRYMVPFEDGDMLKIPYGCGWDNSEISRFRPIFLISMRNEDMMTQDTTKKSAPENEETILDTFNEKQRLVLYYLLGKAVEGEETVRDVLDTLNEKHRFVNKAVEGEETILDVLDTLNEKQRLVLNYFVNKAVKDAKKGKTSKPKNNNTEPAAG